MKIVIKKGLDIPIAGKPEGALQTLPKPRQISLNLDPFEDIRFKVQVKVGETVKIGQPLVENKALAGQFFVAPAAGTISEIRRGLKRRLLDIVIDVAPKEEYLEHGPLNFHTASKEEILERFMKGGIFPHIRMRPFNLIANPNMLPRDIFVSAVETLPFNPPAELQVEKHEENFQAGLETLSKLTTGRVHLVHRENSSSRAFTQAKSAEKHFISGPHPAGNSSVHIHFIKPITKSDDYVWTLSVIDVITIGEMVLKGRYFTDRIVSVSGNGILEKKTGFFQARSGFPISELTADRLSNQLLRLISGDLLIGMRVEKEDFLGFYHTAFSAIPENTTREPFHFLKLGVHKYSATRTYLSGHVKPPKKGYDFTTNQHGEERAFIDGSIYDKVMPMRIPTMHLVKAILAENFELAEQLGILEVASEDFALPTFICPSKIEMVEIVKKGIHLYSKEMGH